MAGEEISRRATNYPPSYRAVNLFPSNILLDFHTNNDDVHTAGDILGHHGCTLFGNGSKVVKSIEGDCNKGYSSEAMPRLHEILHAARQLGFMIKRLPRR